MMVRAAVRSDASRIVALSNSAFMADAFFKTPEAHLRFTQPEVVRMMSTERAEFLLASNTSDEPVGSIFFEWERDEATATLTGKFSAVSVPHPFARQGIGAALVRIVEERTLEVAAQHHCSAACSEMSVVNVRPDLFAWYGKQGYCVVAPILPSPPSFAALVAPSAGDVHSSVR